MGILRCLRKSFQHNLSEIPVIDLTDFLSNGSYRSGLYLCEHLYHYNAVLVRDPRIDFNLNKDYLSLMQKYFTKRSNQFKETGQLIDSRPEVSFEAGILSEKSEKQEVSTALLNDIPYSERPRSLDKPSCENKWRYLYAVGELRPKKDDKFLDPENKNPEDFPEFENVMSSWGNQLLRAGETVSEMIAVGFKMERDSFLKKTKGAHSLLSPSAINLKGLNEETVISSIHYDFNFLTLHASCGFPGLYIWNRYNKRIPVDIPNDCLLVQNGEMLERLTSGYLKKSLHEVVFDNRLKSVLEQMKIGNEKDVWRTSSTFFMHCASEELLDPIGVFWGGKKDFYEGITAGELKLREIQKRRIRRFL